MSMSQQLVKSEDIRIEDNTFLVLKENLYKEAKSDHSIRMVINYCVARNIDPLLKAVHIVPMWNKDAGKQIDTIMPGIGLYRIIAARSGQYAGISEPIFGPIVTQKLGSISVTFPEWCMITVKKIIQDHIVEFQAKEYWIENYAQFKKDDPTPNSMWQKRKYGQLAKCTEAQALRKAFPEVGHDYTYEELQGKTFDIQQDKPAYVKAVVVETKQIENEVQEDYQDILDMMIDNIKECENIKELQKVFTLSQRDKRIRNNKKHLYDLTKAKDTRKIELENKLIAIQEGEKWLNDYDSETGEVSKEIDQ